MTTLNAQLSRRFDGPPSPTPNNGFPAEMLLTDLKSRGVTHVDFNANRKRPNPTPIDDVITSLQSRPK
jgi:hypothetical protein